MAQHERQRKEPAESRLRLQTAVRLRWFGVIGQLLTVCFVYLVLGFPLPFGICLALIALSAWLNVFLRIRYPGRTRLSAQLAVSLLAYDILQLAGLLYLTGGVENPFTFLLVAPVTVSAATVPPRSTIALGVLAAARQRLAGDPSHPLPWYGGTGLELPTLYKLGVLASVLSGMMFLALYVWRLAKEARQMTDALAATEMVLAREQQLHALDGLAAAAAHELGTPLATITLVTKELARELPPELPHRRGHRAAAGAGGALPRNPAQADAHAVRARPAARAHEHHAADRRGGRPLSRLRCRHRRYCPARGTARSAPGAGRASVGPA